MTFPSDEAITHYFEKMYLSAAKDLLAGRGIKAVTKKCIKQTGSPDQTVDIIGAAEHFITETFGNRWKTLSPIAKNQAKIFTEQVYNLVADQGYSMDDAYQAVRKEAEGL